MPTGHGEHAGQFPTAARAAGSRASGEPPQSTIWLLAPSVAALYEVVVMTVVKCPPTFPGPAPRRAVHGARVLAAHVQLAASRARSGTTGREAGTPAGEQQRRLRHRPQTPSQARPAQFGGENVLQMAGSGRGEGCPQGHGRPTKQVGPCACPTSGPARTVSTRPHAQEELGPWPRTPSPAALPASILASMRPAHTQLPAHPWCPSTAQPPSSVNQ